MVTSSFSNAFSRCDRTVCGDNHKLPRDLLVRLAGANQRQDLELARRHQGMRAARTPRCGPPVKGGEVWSKELQDLHVPVGDGAAFQEVEIEPSHEPLFWCGQPEGKTVRCEVPNDLPPEVCLAHLAVGEHVRLAHREQHQLGLRWNRLLLGAVQAERLHELLPPERWSLDPLGSGEREVDDRQLLSRDARNPPRRRSLLDPLGSDRLVLDDRQLLSREARITAGEHVAAGAAVNTQQPHQGIDHRLGERIRPIHDRGLVEHLKHAGDIRVQQRNRHTLTL